MTSAAKEDWQKPRSNGVHLTVEEIAAVKQGFIDKRSALSVARDLKCARRTVSKYFDLFRAEGLAPVRTSRTGLDSKPKPDAPATPRPSRFYKSNFEL